MTNAPLDTPEKLARFVVGMGYSYEACLAALHKDFPTADARHVIYDAVQKVDTGRAALDDKIEQDAARAIGAEMDLSNTMHEEE